MKARIGVFLLWFTIFYWWLNISWVTPVTLLQYQRGVFWNLRDFFLWMVIALIPYHGLIRFYPGRLLRSVIFISTSIAGIHYIRLVVVYAYGFPLSSYVLKNIHLFFSVPIFGFIYYFIRYGQYMRLRRKKIMATNRQSELDFLLLQSNPHFLFNCLNNIYGLVYERSPKAKSAIASLSQMMRYGYQDMSRKVSLQNELQYITEYISLQQLRYASGLNLSMQTTGDLQTVMIPPMLLMPFVENAIKHGEFSTGSLDIRVDIFGKQSQFYCSNPKKSCISKSEMGIGLQNATRRLALLYGKNHELQISDNPTNYSIRLMIEHECL